jgi:cell wall-associated NlpC family hydrolase
MPVPAYRRTTSIRGVINPALVIIGLVLLAAVVAVSALMAQVPHQRRAQTVFTGSNGVEPYQPVFVPGDAGSKLPAALTPPPSPSPSSPAVTVATPSPAPVLPNPPLVIIPAAPAPPPVETPNGGAAAVAYALRQLGKPYVFGAAGNSAFDCSGLVMRAWQSAGVSLPRTTYEMARVGRRISRDQLQPGDLVLLYSFGHVQLYIGDGEIIEAPHAGAVVRIRALPTQVDAYVRVS